MTAKQRGAMWSCPVRGLHRAHLGARGPLLPGACSVPDPSVRSLCWPGPGARDIHHQALLHGPADGPDGGPGAGCCMGGHQLHAGTAVAGMRAWVPCGCSRQRPPLENRVQFGTPHFKKDVTGLGAAQHRATGIPRGLGCRTREERLGEPELSCLERSRLRGLISLQVPEGRLQRR